MSDGDSTTTTLSYETPNAVQPRPPAIDSAMLLLGSAQSVMALVSCIGMLTQSPSGHYELKYFPGARLPAQDIGLVHRLAWNLFGPVNSMMFVAWFIASLAMAIGSISLDPPVRRRCYRVGAAIVISAIAVMLIALLVLAGSGVNERWVHQSGTAYEWRTIVIEPVYYWQFTVITLIANPALILLALRCLTGICAVHYQSAKRSSTA
jgi:hypothetical protein